MVVLETSVGESEHESARRGGLKPRPSLTGCFVQERTERVV